VKILFIHGNYPAQFRHLAPLIANSGHHRVVFLTNRADAEQHQLAGVEIRRYELHRDPSEHTHHYLHSLEDAVLQGQAALREVHALLDEGFQPNIVVTHAGMGLGLFIKDLLPHARHVGYFEWYFQPNTAQHLVQTFNLDMQLNTSLRNLPILQELERCDSAVVPTEWQKCQFPAAYQHKLEVIFDGIDRQFFRPQTASMESQQQALILHNRDTGEAFQIGAGQRLISYCTRGMEPLRGFPEFMRALPALLKRFADLQVVIAGADRRAYSYDAPSHDGSWKQHLLAELGDTLPHERVLFTGLLNYDDYRSLLWRSDLHCYFTRPYVTSWSLFEAAACGARLAVNACPATDGIAKPNSVNWVSLDEPRRMEQVLARALDYRAPRAILQNGFDLDTSLQQWEKLLNRMLQSS